MADVGAPMAVLIDDTLPFDRAGWTRLHIAFSHDRLVRFDPRAGVSPEAASQAEIAILASDRVLSRLSLPRLRWLHCDQAGLGHAAAPDLVDRVIVTGSAGRSAAALAEHAIMFALLLTWRYPQFYEAQKRREWLRDAGMQDLTPLAGRTLGIVGLGHTGRALAERAAVLGMKVLGYRRRDLPSPPGVAQVYAADLGGTLDPLLAQSDVVALTLSLSDATRGLIGARELGLMKPTSILISLSRGEVVDQDALLAALESGGIAGAGLDVTTPEPLPPDHPLWAAPNTLITPHFTPVSPDRAARSVDIIVENISRYRRGAALLNRLHSEDHLSAWP
jgi:phosphoglycerate dehydrogenase-like enzyme